MKLGFYKINKNSFLAVLQATTDTASPYSKLLYIPQLPSS